MKHHKRIYWVLPVLVIILLLITGCISTIRQLVENSTSIKNPQSPNIIAQIGDRTITLSDFEKKFADFSQGGRRVANSSEQRKKFLEKLVQKTLFSLEARAQNIDKDEMINSQIQDAVDGILAREYFKREAAADKLTVTEDEIKYYYDANPDEFKTIEKVKVSHILIKVYPTAGPEGIAKARTRAKELKSQLAKGADFATLAKQNSDDPATKKKGGSIGYLTRGKKKFSPEFTEAAFSLKAGEISDLVESPEGFHIIKVDARIPEQIRPLEKVKGRIKYKLGSEKRKALLEGITERLKERYGVKSFIGVSP